MSVSDLRQYHQSLTTRLTSSFFELGATVYSGPHVTCVAWHGREGGDQTLLYCWSSENSSTRAVQIFADTVDVRLQIADVLAGTIQLDP